MYEGFEVERKWKSAANGKPPCTGFWKYQIFQDGYACTEWLTPAEYTQFKEDTFVEEWKNKA